MVNGGGCVARALPFIAWHRASGPWLRYGKGNVVMVRPPLLSQPPTPPTLGPNGIPNHPQAPVTPGALAGGDRVPLGCPGVELGRKTRQEWT
ncbi:hypothetical protein Pmani_027449 [Petrolisthes manimaculis]|uniref:Uncharacterized protein n=1 Tax=Petrolisthes manimaculis TaxID=1843537 RepID=A0AAE1TWH4_9EUCA|nr:hypothetical protein Pmani_027449 [Petrolisthes manimaculis]